MSPLWILLLTSSLTTGLPARSNRAKIRITPYRESSLITFKEIGPLLPVTSEWNVNILVNADDIMSLGVELKSKLDSIKQHLKCYNSSNSPCKISVDETDDCIIDGVHRLAGLFKTEHHKVKRGIDILGWAIGQVTGQMDAYDKAAVVGNLSTVQDTQRQIINQAQEGKQLLLEVFADIQTTKQFATNISIAADESIQQMRSTWAQNDAEDNARQQLDHATQKFTRTVDAVVDLITFKRITGRIVSPTTLEDTYNKLKLRAGASEYFPFETLSELAAHREAEITLHGHIIIATLTTPTTKTDQWQAKKLVLRPVISNNVVTMMTLPFGFVATSATNEVSALTSINDCAITFDGIRVCKLPNAVNPSNAKSCLTDAWVSRSIDNDLCKTNLHHAQITSDLLIRFDDNEVLIAPADSLTTTIICDDAEQETIKITIPTLITSDQPCLITAGTSAFFLISKDTITTKQPLKSASGIEWQQPNTWPSTPTFPRLTETQLENAAQLGAHIKDLNDRHIEIRQAAVETQTLTAIWGAVSAYIILAVIMFAVTATLCCCIRR